MGEDWLSALGPRPFCNDDRGDSAPWAEVSFDLSPHRARPAHDVVEYLVDNVFLEDPKVAVGLQVFFQGLEFKAQLGGHVADSDYAEVRQACLGAHGSELRVFYHDFVTGK